MHPLAMSSNRELAGISEVVLSFLSERGKKMYFPHQGILGQSAAAAGKRFNATIGIACEDDLSPMRLGGIERVVDLPAAKIFPYASSFGNAELRTVWKGMLNEKNPSLAGKEISVPLVTNGITHAIYTAGYLFLNPEDEILVAAPFWDNYSLLLEDILGAKIATLPFFDEAGGIDVAALEAALVARRGKHAVLLFNYPNNPTGYTPLESELDKIIGVIAAAAENGTRIVVLVDDAYFGLVYEAGVATESIFARLVGAHDNVLAVKIDGATKEDYAWGLRVGFVTLGGKSITARGYQLLVDKLAGVIRGVISNGSQLSQSLLLNAYKTGDYQAQKKERYRTLKHRYEVIKAELQRRAEFATVFSPLPYNSGYFMCLRLHGVDAEAVRVHLLEKYDTGVIALQGLIRIAYSSMPAKDIPALMDNIYRACVQVKAEKNSGAV